MHSLWLLILIKTEYSRFYLSMTHLRCSLDKNYKVMNDEIFSEIWWRPLYTSSLINFVRGKIHKLENFSWKWCGQLFLPDILMSFREIKVAFLATFHLFSICHIFLSINFFYKIARRIEELNWIYSQQRRKWVWHRVKLIKPHLSQVTHWKLFEFQNS